MICHRGEKDDWKHKRKDEILWISGSSKQICALGIIVMVNENGSLKLIKERARGIKAIF